MRDTLKIAGQLSLLFAAIASALRADRITIATYNIENYTLADRMVEGVYHTSYPKPEAEKTALRAVLRATRADFIAVQEMGPPSYLEELRRDLAKEGSNYPFVESCEGEDKDRQVAVLSRWPFQLVRKHLNLGFEYFGRKQTVKRGALEIHLTVGKSEVVLFVVHLKSRITDRPDDPDSALRRASESRAIRERVLSSIPSLDTTPIVVLGDFNDVPRSKALQLWLKRGKTKLLQMLPASDSRGERWTHHYQREDSYSRIDYMLVSSVAQKATIDGAAQIVDVPETLAASDHRPLVATFDFE